MTAARDGPFVPAEFDCCECGRHIVFFSAEVTPEPPLCMACLMRPGGGGSGTRHPQRVRQSSAGWFTDPRIRAATDPDHDGREPSLEPQVAP